MPCLLSLAATISLYSMHGITVVLFVVQLLSILDKLSIFTILSHRYRCPRPRKVSFHLLYCWSWPSYELTEKAFNQQHYNGALEDRCSVAPVICAAVTLRERYRLKVQLFNLGGGSAPARACGVQVQLLCNAAS